MLELTFKTEEGFDASNKTFVPGREVTLKLQHSLVSLAKWESKWCKPFLGKDKNRKLEETMDYIRCMTITQNVDPSVYHNLPDDILKKVNNYIEAPMTGATIQSNRRTSPNREIITADIVYYWMVSLNIPMECQKWHLNRLLMLIRICNIKASKDNTMSKRDTMKSNQAQNAARRRESGSKG
jgi:hypothetical protein